MLVKGSQGENFYKQYETWMDSRYHNNISSMTVEIQMILRISCIKVKNIAQGYLSCICLLSGIKYYLIIILISNVAVSLGAMKPTQLNYKTYDKRNECFNAIAAM